MIRVIDHGRGVPREEREAIFRAFQRRGDDSTGGVGLGLAVAAGFLRAINGTLELEDTPGGGSTFVLRFPRRFSKVGV